MKTIVFDAAKCNGCRNCQIVCKDEHCGNDWSPYALPQPDTGQFWLEVEDVERGTVPKVRVDFIVHMCQHCAGEAPCMKAAADAGVPDAVYRRDDGFVVIDPARSRGLDLSESCPYGSVYYNAELEVSQKCTGCAHLLDDGWEVPRCVQACPHGALAYVEEGEHPERDRFEGILPDSGCEPRLRYLNLPKRFVAGVVVDPDADEVIIGARVTMQNLDTGEVLVTETDDFGDFWFEQVAPANYLLYFEADGHMTRTCDADAREADRNVGEVLMFQPPAGQ